MDNYMSQYGTRQEHLMELQKIWSDCLGMLTCKGWHTMQEKERALELEIALEILNKHVEYEFTGVEYARVINNLPKDARDIPDIEEKNDAEPYT
jgi:hypothetical protein